MKKNKGDVSKRLGRPPKTSRKEILDCALTLLREGEDALSIRNLASKLAIRPAVIYNYFANKDELIEQLAGMVLDGLWVECGVEGPWQKALRSWMNRFHESLIKSPELMHLIALSATSPNMIGNLKKLANLIQRAGISPTLCARHAQSLLWEVIGFSFLRVQGEKPDTVARYKNAPIPKDLNSFTKLLMNEDYGKLWEVTRDRSIDGLEVYAKKNQKSICV